MEGLTRKTFTTSRALTYTYYDTQSSSSSSSSSSSPSSSAVTSPTSSLLAAARNPNHSSHSHGWHSHRYSNGFNYAKSNSSSSSGSGSGIKPTILFLHGFPDSSFLWSRIIPALQPLGHRMIAPDLLGHGETAKPGDAAAYTSDLMTGDLAELLANERVAQCIVVGHDWGAFLAQRMWLWRGPGLVVGLATLSIAYMPPDRDTPFNLEYLNYAMEEATGHARYAYWEYFTEPDAAALTRERALSFWTALHGNRDNWLRDLFCRSGAIREYIEADRTAEVKEYARDGNGWKEEYLARINKYGFDGAFNWYKVYVLGLNWQKERHIRRSRLVVRVPTLFIACSRDDICLPSLIEPSRQAGLLPDLVIREIDSTHWVTMEKPAEVVQALSNWLQERW